VSEPDFMARLRALKAPKSMPISRAIRDFILAHPPGPDQDPEVIYELVHLLMLSVMRLEGRVAVLEERSEVSTEFMKAIAEIFPQQG
jgi:hypothetical protein